MTSFKNTLDYISVAPARERSHSCSTFASPPRWSRSRSRDTPRDEHNNTTAKSEARNSSFLFHFPPSFPPTVGRQRPPAPRSLSPLWMATAPNMEMIASSLRSCSLNGGGRRPGRRHRHGHARGAEGSNDSEGVTVELNSDVALPYHWQQCLDIRVRTRPHLYIPSFVPLHNIRIGGRTNIRQGWDRWPCAPVGVRAWACALSQSFGHK